MQRKEKKCQNPNCKVMYLPYRSTQKVCSLDCAIVLASLSREKETNKKKKEAEATWRKRKKELKAADMTVTDWVQKVQKVFNSYIRERDKGGLCISCRRPLVGKYDAGHYYNANNHYSVRFDPRNVSGQCVQCNRDLNGNLIEYGVNLEKKIGTFQMEELRKIAKDTRKYTVPELKDLEIYWKRELKDLQDRKKKNTENR
jgi:hypothetical protein